MKRKRARAAKGSAFGRILEILADLVLILVILAFGVSIAARYNPEKSPEPREMRRGYSPPPAEPRRSEAAPPAAERGAAVRGDDDRGRVARSGEAEASRSPAGSPDRDPAPARGTRHKITVDIRNGCGRVGLAEDMMHAIRRAGFDVVEYRNADRYDYPRTEIRDRTDGPETAELRDWLRREYGVGEVVKDSGRSAGADVQLVLGADLADTLRRRERASR